MKEGLFIFKEKKTDAAQDAVQKKAKKVNLFFAMTAARFSEITIKVFLKI